MSAVSDTNAALSDIWTELAEEIEEQLALAQNNDERVRLIQNYLIQQLTSGRNDLQVNYCLQQVQLWAGAVSISKLTNDIGISQRHLSRKFQQHIGLSPKAYLRVYRFINSLQHLKMQPCLSLTEIAYKSGYYDQSHFNRDYKTYAGCSPAQLRDAQHILY